MPSTAPQGAPPPPLFTSRGEVLLIRYRVGRGIGTALLCSVVRQFAQSHGTGLVLQDLIVVSRFLTACTIFTLAATVAEGARWQFVCTPPNPIHERGRTHALPLRPAAPPPGCKTWPPCAPPRCCWRRPRWPPPR